ncbi:MAG: PSP1 C-terminal domain-containing protein [Isosphaeraceae bacterium]
MAVAPAYLIRYGVMSYVGRFRPAAECTARLERGQSVVIKTERGVELGEVLLTLDGAGAAKARSVEWQCVLRPAEPDDLDRSRRAEASRADRFTACRRVLEEAGWPWELVDVEPLLEEGVTVLQYLGPHHLDAADLRARFRITGGLDVVLEPVGADEEPAETGCGTGGCGSCSESGSDSSSGCGSSKGSHGGCSSCGLRRKPSERVAEPAADPA